VVNDVKNAVVSSVYVGLNEPRTVYEHFSLQFCHHFNPYVSVYRTNDTVLHNHVPKVAAWCSGNGVWRINEVTLRQARVSTGMGDRFRRANHLSILPSQPGQLSLLLSAGWEMSTSQKCGDALRLGSKGRYGSFHLWISVWVAV